MQPTQHMPIHMGQAGPNGLDGQIGQTNNAMFGSGLQHNSMGSDPLTSALSMLPPELLGSHPHMHQPFGQMGTSQPNTSTGLMSHVHNQMQPAHQALLGQQPRGPQGQPGQTPDNQQQQSSRQGSQQRSSSQSSRNPQQQSQHQQQQQQQQQQLSGQQGQSLRSHNSMHLSSQSHQPSPQPQQTPNLAQLLASTSAALGPQPSLLQQHASILNDTRSSVSSFSASMHDAKQATPADRADIRNVVVMLERASKALVSELDQGISKLRALSTSPAINSFGAGGMNQLGQGNGQDLFGALNNFGMPGMQQQQQPQGRMPFDMNMTFQPTPQQNGVFNMNGSSNANGASNGYSGPFQNNDLGAGQQGANAQSSPFLSALLAQYLNQSTDPSSRLGALSIFQSIANNNGGQVPGMNPSQSLDALLGGQAMPPSQTTSSQQQQQPSRTGMSAHQAAAQLANGAPLTNQAALAALTSLGITPTMLDALGLGSVAQQMLNAPADGAESGSKSATRASPGLRDNSPDPDQNDLSAEPARKKRKQGRGKPLSSSPAEPSASKQHAQAVENSKLIASVGRPSSVPNGSTKMAGASTTSDRNILPSPSGIPSGPAAAASSAAVAGPSDASSSSSSKRIPTLGVGLRQEGDKRYRNRKLLRDLREHLYRWLGTDEFRKLRNTYKVAEWVPNPHLTDEEKQILASLPPGAVAQPPITTHIFHVDFTSRDFYRTNQSLIDAIVTEGSKKVEAKPEAYAIVPGTIDRDHLEDVAKDLMDSARSGFRMSLRTGLQAEKEDKEKHEKYRGVERAKTKCRNREIGAGRLRHAIPKQLLIPGAYSDDAASDEDLHGLTKSEWKRQRLRKLRIAKGWEAVTPKWRNKHLTRAYHKADIVSKSKQMARWRRDDPVDLPIPIKLYGKLLPKQLFDEEWLREHRRELEDEPYCIRINDAEIDGWEESHHPLGEDTSDEMEWSDAKESSVSRAGRGLMQRESSTRSPVPGPSVAMKGGGGERSAMPITNTSADAHKVKTSPDPTTASISAPNGRAEDVSPPPPPATTTTAAGMGKKTAPDQAAVAEGSGTSSISGGSSRSEHADAGDTGGSDSDSEVDIDMDVPTNGDTAKATPTQPATKSPQPEGHDATTITSRSEAQAAGEAAPANEA